MSEIRVNKVLDEAGTGQVELTQGATIPTGKIIAGAGSIQVTGGITGNLTGNASGSSGSCTGNANSATTAEGLTGTPNITVGVVNATSGSVSGNFSVGGVLTYEAVSYTHLRAHET